MIALSARALVTGAFTIPLSTPVGDALAASAGPAGSTHANLTKAIAGEQHESRTMYPALAKRAKAAGAPRAAERFSNNAEHEAGHARAFQQSLDRLSQQGS
ncbi:ferritin family protein [Nonomuraea sp. NPDC050227]|uniref:ferritin family protein n=1 Tax=Nonomuraea sp. NPDC050227 TaxID=3364360 RepID=UPI0037903ACE